MTQQNNHRTPKLDYLMLLPIMALAFYIAFIPHYNYPYPVHIDEWVHLAFSKAMLRLDSSPFLLETGFHLFWVYLPNYQWYFEELFLDYTVLSILEILRPKKHKLNPRL